MFSLRRTPPPSPPHSRRSGDPQPSSSSNLSDVSNEEEEDLPEEGDDDFLKGKQFVEGIDEQLDLSDFSKNLGRFGPEVAVLGGEGGGKEMSNLPPATYKKAVTISEKQSLDASKFPKSKYKDPDDVSSYLSPRNKSKPGKNDFPEWLPSQGKSTYEGEITTQYKQALSMVIANEANAFIHMNKAKELYPGTGCILTINIWVKIMPALSIAEKRGATNIAKSLATYLLHQPDYLDPYLTGISDMHKVKSDNKDPLENLETRITALALTVENLTSSAKNFVSETIQFTSQLTNISTAWAGLQSTLEGLITKIMRRDVGAPSIQSPSYAISLPSTSGQSTKHRVKLVNFKEDGEYKGLYQFKISGGCIVSLSPPSSYPLIDRIMSYKPSTQETFVNLDQERVFARLAKTPELSKAFRPKGTVGRADYLKRLGEGVLPKEYQWDRIG